MPRSLPPAAALAVVCASAAPASSEPLVGLNLAETPYYGSELIFNDLALHLAPWFGQEVGADYGASRPGGVTFAPSGTPTAFADDHFARSLWDRPRGSAGGTYEVSWEGTGGFRWNNQFIAGAGGNRQTVTLADVPAAASQRQLYSLESTDRNRLDPADPFRNLSIRAVGTAAPADRFEDFQSSFTDRWSDFGSFRYMDWGRTNNSAVSTWADRTQPDAASQAAETGVALEFQIGHANATGSQPWFNLPHLATDGYVREAATLIRDSLDPGLVARVELSNEVWNTGFLQWEHAFEQGNLSGPDDPEGGLGGNEFQNASRWYAKRSVEVFQIFEEVFTDGGRDPAGMNRLVRVVGGQSANPAVAREILNFGDTAQHVDALAVAPYFGRFLTNENSAGTASDPGPWLAADALEDPGERDAALLALVEAELQRAIAEIDAHAELLGLDGSGTAYPGLDLFAYEGGQSLAVAGDLHGDPNLVQLMAELSRKEEMENFYFRYLNAWEEAGGSDMLLFNSVSDYDQFGNWGLLEHEGQGPADAPKLRGVLKYLDTRVVPEPGAALILAAAAPLLLRRRRPSRR